MIAGLHSDYQACQHVVHLTEFTMSTTAYLMELLTTGETLLETREEKSHNYKCHWGALVYPVSEFRVSVITVQVYNALCT